MGWARSGLKLAGLTCLFGLAACTDAPWNSDRPEARPAVETPDLPPVEPSQASKDLAAYYRRLQNDLLAQELLRGDGGGPDASFTNTILVRNFVRIALFDEYTTDGDFLRPQATLSRLRKWDQLIRMSVEFGPSISADQRQLDRTSVAAFADRLARITGLSIIQTKTQPNFHVIFASEDDRPGFETRIREIVPGISTSSLNAMMNLPREQLCIVVAFSEGGSASYSKAIALIRAEHPPLLRTSCIHEELAQGLGLANDSPQARPSIFNDDEEYGLRTTHDELLLQMLYDNRLKTGMTPAEAAPIARIIARELLPATSS